MSFTAQLKCLGCGKTFAPDTVMNLCPEDHRPVQLELDLDRLKANRVNNSWYSPDRKSMWRFGGLLGLDIDDPTDRSFVTTLGEGHTPEIDLSHLPIAKQAGITLRIKDEGMPHKGYGANPTLSFKDRGMAMAVSMARKLGITKVVTPTQGNAGDSLTRYGQEANMDVAITMPDATPMPIKGSVAYAAMFNPKVSLDLVKGTIKEAGALAKEKYVANGYFSMATFQEPGWRIEGKKTLGLEVAEPKTLGGTWELPDVVIYPTGGGTGILGMWKAWDELEALGLISSRRPRVIAVQSSATAPVVKAFTQGTKEAPVEAGETTAFGLNVPGGVGHFRVLEIIRASEGHALALDDDVINQSMSSLFYDENLWACPEGAATIAAIPQLLDEGVIKKGDEVVAFNTGSLEKYLPDLRSALVH